jgi:hypothetical protein
LEPMYRSRGNERTRSAPLGGAGTGSLIPLVLTRAILARGRLIRQDNVTMGAAG